jgi:WD40 repeat protein
MMMLWDLSARRVRLSTIPLVNRVYHLRWHPSTNVIAAATAYRVVLADPESGKVAEVSAPEAVKRIEWAMAGSLLMVSAESPRETEIFRFTAPPDSPLQTTREMTLPSNVVAFDSAAPRYAWLDDQDQIHVVDWEGGEVDLLSSPVSRVNEIFFGPGDRLAWLAGETHVVHTRLGSGTLIQAKLDEVANVVDWLSEDRIMVSGNRFFGPPVWIVDARGHVTNVPDAHNSPIFSSDQKKLVFVWPHTRSTWQGSLQEMHGDDPRLVRRMIGQGRSPAAATWQPDGTHYAVGHGATVYFTEPRESVDNPEANGLIELYRSSGEFVRTIARPAVVPASLLWSVDGQSFMAGCRDGTMRTWSRSGVAQQVRSAHETTVTDLDRHPNGEVLVSASSRGSVKLWHDDGTVEELFAADLEHEMKVDATFRPRLGDHLLVCREHGWLLSYPPTDERRAIVPCERGTWLFDGSGLVTLSSEAANYLTMPHLDLRGTPIDDREFSAIAASSTSEEVLVGGMFSLRRCNSHISAASPLYRQAYGKASIRSIDYSPDDQRIAVISTYLPDQGPVFPVCWLWSADNQPDEVPLEGHRLFGNVSSVRFNHRGDTILAAGDPGIVMWDLASRSLQRVIVPLPDGQSVTLASDGRILQRTPNALQHLYGVVEHEDGTLETVPATAMDW